MVSIQGRFPHIVRLFNAAKCETYVHKPSMAHAPKIFNTAKRKLAFLPDKSNRW